MRKALTNSPGAATDWLRANRRGDPSVRYGGEPAARDKRVGIGGLFHGLKCRRLWNQLQDAQKQLGFAQAAKFIAADDPLLYSVAEAAYEHALAEVERIQKAYDDAGCGD